MSASNMPGIDAAKRPLDRVGPELGIAGLWLYAERSLTEIGVNAHSSSRRF
jgi:hypothetical protein